MGTTAVKPYLLSFAMRKQKSTPNRRVVAARRQYIDPPRFQSVTSITRSYRFINSTAFNSSITVNDLISVAGGICSVANTTMAPIAVSVHLHRIRVWAAPGTTAAASTVSVRWNTASGSVVPMREDSDTSLSTARPIFLESTPPRGCFAWLPLGPSTSGVFGLTMPAGGVIEIHMTHWCYDTGSAPVGTFTITVATAVGIMQYGYLDQTTTKYFAPVGLPAMT